MLSCSPVCRRVSLCFCHRICLDLPVLICFCDKPYYISTHLRPSANLELHCASHIFDKLSSMRPTDLNTPHPCLCFVDSTLRFLFLLLVVFPAIPLHLIFSQCVFISFQCFFSHFPKYPFTIPLETHLQSIEDVCILARLDVYTSALSATCFRGRLGLFIYTKHLIVDLI